MHISSNFLTVCSYIADNSVYSDEFLSFLHTVLRYTSSFIKKDSSFVVLPSQLTSQIVYSNYILNDTFGGLTIAEANVCNAQIIIDQIKCNNIIKQYVRSFDRSDQIIYILTSAMNSEDINNNCAIKMIEPVIKKCISCHGILKYQRHKSAKLYTRNYGSLDIIHYSKTCEHCNISFFNDYYQRSISQSEIQRVYYNFDKSKYITFSSQTLVEKDLLSFVESILYVSKISFDQITNIFNHFHRQYIQDCELKMNNCSNLSQGQKPPKKKQKKNHGQQEPIEISYIFDSSDENELGIKEITNSKNTLKRRYAFDKRHVWNCFVINKLNKHVSDRYTN